MPKTDAQESFHAGDDRLTTRSGHSFEHSRVLFDEFGSDSADQGASASSQAGETDTSVVGMGRTLDQPPWVAASSCSAAPVRPGWSRASNPACVEVGLCLRSTSTASFLGGGAGLQVLPRNGLRRKPRAARLHGMHMS